MLNNNMISKMESGTFSGLENLRWLDLSSNRMKFKLKGYLFTPLKSLETLLMSRVAGKSGIFVKKAFYNMTSLKTFVYDHNRQFVFPSFWYKGISLAPKLETAGVELESYKRVEQKSPPRSEVSAKTASGRQSDPVNRSGLFQRLA